MDISKPAKFSHLLTELRFSARSCAEVPPGARCAQTCRLNVVADSCVAADHLRHCYFGPAEHEARDPEYSILKQRLARRLRYEGAEEEEVQDMSLVVRFLPPRWNSSNACFHTRSRS